MVATGPARQSLNLVANSREEVRSTRTADLERITSVSPGILNLEITLATGSAQAQIKTAEGTYEMAMDCSFSPPVSNLLTFSEELDFSHWYYKGPLAASILQNDVTSPAGRNDAFLVGDNSTAGLLNLRYAYVSVICWKWLVSYLGSSC